MTDDEEDLLMMTSSCHSKRKIFCKQHDKELTQNIPSLNKITWSALNQRTTPDMPSVSRRKHKQTSNTRDNLLYYPFASNETNKTTVKLMWLLTQNNLLL